MAKDEVRFLFGKNWRSFVESALDDRRIAIAVDSMRRLVKLDDLEAKTFLDVGCGSGLFSLAACRLGAKQVTGFDHDLDSVRASRLVREAGGIAPERWRIEQGSVLDESFLATLAPADVVYAWGVLHHTGDMWRAIGNASRLVRPGGRFVLAIYNRLDHRIGGSRWWRVIKRSYSASPRPLQVVMEWLLFAYRVVRMLLRLDNPLRVMAEYRRNRGMSYWHDLVDWLGGYPYEFAPAGEVFEFVSGLGRFRLLALHTTSSLGNHELTFLREAGPPGGAEPPVGT